MSYSVDNDSHKCTISLLTVILQDGQMDRRVPMALITHIYVSVLCITTLFNPQHAPQPTPDLLDVKPYCTVHYYHPLFP